MRACTTRYAGLFAWRYAAEWCTAGQPCSSSQAVNASTSANGNVSYLPARLSRAKETSPRFLSHS